MKYRSNMEKLFYKKITRDIGYTEGMFADESDFDFIRKHISIEYEPVMIPIAEMMSHEAIILKTGGLVITDDDDYSWNEGFKVPEHWLDYNYTMTPEEEMLSYNNSHWTIHTMYLDTGKPQMGQISNIPMNVMVCTLVLKENLQNDVNFTNKQKPNYLTDDELNFLTN